MKTRFLAIAVPVMLLASVVSSWAMHSSVSSGTGHSGPITTIPATTLPKSALVFEISTELINFETYSESALLRFAAEDREIHDMDSLHNYFLGVSYGISDTTTVHARIPYVYRSDIRESEPPDEVHVHGDSKGIGDLSVHVHHRIYNDTTSGLSAALLAGIKFPTGRTDARDREGDKFEAEFQPGSGSWDPAIGLAVTKKVAQFSLDANLAYKFVTEGTQNTDLGDIFQYNAAVSFRPVSDPFLLDLILEGNGQWIEKEKINGSKDPDTGGNIIFISPGIRLTFRKAFAAYLSYGIPVSQDLNGEQSEYDSRLVFGLNLAFN